MMDRIEDIGKHFGRKINTTKIKLMVIDRKPIINTALTGNWKIVLRLKYQSAFADSLPLALRLRVIKYYITPILLYGAET